MIIEGVARQRAVAASEAAVARIGQQFGSYGFNDQSRGAVVVMCRPPADDFSCRLSYELKRDRRRRRELLHELRSRGNA